MTAADTIANGRAVITAARLDPTNETQLLLVFDQLTQTVIPARDLVSEALTILRDPAMASRLAHASVAAADRLEQALALLDGRTEPEQ